MALIMLTLTAHQADAITAIDRTRTDGGLGVTFDGTDYLVRDVRGEAAYAEYQDILADARHYGVVTALQGLRAIQAAGLVTAFLAWKTSLDPVTDFEALAFLEKAQTWRSDDPILNAAMTALGIADQKDALFALAAAL